MVASAPSLALALAYAGIVFACLWRGRLRWIGAPMAAAVAIWPRPAPPVAWIAADADDAAVVMQGQEVALKPGKRAYATQLWAQRRGFVLPADAEAAQAGAFDCDRRHCTPLQGVEPRLATWWGRMAPKPAVYDAICTEADIVIMRAVANRPAACSGALVLTPDDFIAGGSAEIFRDDRGWRVSWAQPIRGQRPWTEIQW